ncbi:MULTISPECIES: acyl-CoA dehydrogenase family protein [Rhodomicrobium]|uniref:acyl-CoA dehydrogenase family protein n=1 Tax=Rhodomicrobium TaxID=1068 RepID=UPI000B4BA3BC|nr:MULTISPECIES: acyl-CoA dehydrogenase family protein [Rhodomicrobium]
MDLRFTDDEIAFRNEVRHFFRTAIPAEIRRKFSEGEEVSREDMVTSQRILNAKGWATPRWPVAWGGQDWTPIQHYIYLEELQFNSVPQPLQFNVDMVGPVIAAFGNDAQKRQFLPRIANLDDWWAQGFSEPGAGSDLASLKTRAIRDGGHYIVTGQKTWTTLAQYANWIFCLVRTDPEAKKQMGISFLLIDMATPGVVVRPIITIDGRHEVNEVFFDDVKVPVANLVGEENRGWDYAKFLLANERTGIARVGITKQRLARVKEIARQTPAGEGSVWDDAAFRSRAMLAEIELKALELTQMRVVAEQAKSGGNRPNPASSILKIKGSELQQTVSELLLEAAGPNALAFRGYDVEPGSNDPLAELAWAGLAAQNYFNYRKVSIYGGSNEIQHNIISKAVLGL